MAKNKKNVRTVLITRFSALGDVALTIPVIYPVCRANPDVNFVLANQTWPATMMVDAPHNLTVVDVDVKGRYKGFRGMWRLAEKLKRHYNIDAIADLHSVIRSWIIDFWMHLHGVRVSRIDKERMARRALVKHKPGAHVTPTLERYRLVFEKLGLNAPKNTFTRLFDGKQLPTSALVPKKGEDECWIAVSPFSVHKGKEYSLKQMYQVVERLSQLPNTHIFLMGGGKSEKLALRPLAKRFHNVTSLAEIKHAFLDEFALLGKCDVMLSMDSANMHLASLMAVPVVSVWGATTPQCGFLGYRQSEDNAVQLDLPCRPCAIYGEKDCKFKDYHCLTGISPDTIVERVLQVVKR